VNGRLTLGRARDYDHCALAECPYSKQALRSGESESQAGAAMTSAFNRVLFLLLAAVACIAATEARADLRLCNRMSYVAETSIALEEKGQASTRGWFRLDPGQCRVVLQGTITAEQFYVHARVPAAYGDTPFAQGQSSFCVGTGNFVLNRPRNCGSGQTTASFNAVRPTETEAGLTAYLAEDAEYTDAQARDAGVQRLLVVAGYDANPIDGIRGAKTDQALIQFLNDHNLPATTAGRTDFFNILLEAAQKPGVGFSWCNDVSYTVMAAIGIEDANGLVTRGWYRVEPGKCVRPDITGHPLRLYSFGEAVDADGQPAKRGDKTMSWGGDTIICTRNVKFEMTDRTDCAAKGLSSAGFATIDLAGRSTTIVRFK
jgi:uncharacterized membrane protein